MTTAPSAQEGCPSTRGLVTLFSPKKGDESASGARYGVSACHCHPPAHTSRTSLPQLGSQPITVVSDTGHCSGEEGRQQCFSNIIVVAFLVSANSQAQRNQRLICTPCSHYSVHSFQGRMCLHLYLSNSKLLASSNVVLSAAVEAEVGTGTGDGLPSVIILLSFCFSQG